MEYIGGIEEMDKDKILQQARKNIYKGKEYENDISSKGDLLGLFTAFIVYVVLFLVEYISKRTYNFGATAVIFSASSVQLLYEGIKTKRNIFTIAGTLLGITATAATLYYIMQVTLL